MQWAQDFIVEGVYMGQSMRTWTTNTKDAAAPTGSAFFCPTCANLWAVCPIADRPFMVMTRGCLKHQKSPFDGSVWTGWDQDFLEALPLPLFARELTLAAARLEAE